MTEQELQEAYWSTPEWKDCLKKEQIWADLDHKANKYAQEADDAQTTIFDALAALYATDEYKAWEDKKR